MESHYEKLFAHEMNSQLKLWDYKLLENLHSAILPNPAMVCRQVIFHVRTHSSQLETGLDSFHPLN